MEKRSCSFVLHFVESKGTQLPPSDLANEIKLDDDVPSIVAALKKAIKLLLINGETTLLPHDLFVTTNIVQDLTVHKMILLYLELIIDKTDHIKVPKTILIICRYLRFNLHHPNEFIRGVTLRFLFRLNINNETEIIKPLIPSIIANLNHPHPYVKRNTVLAAMSICNRQVIATQGEQQLLVDKIERLLLSSSEEEKDASTKRNAFLMLSNCAQDRAINYLLSNADRVSDWGEPLQMVALELIQKVWRRNKAEKMKFINIIISLMDAHDSIAASVVYESVGTLVSLTSAPTAIRAAAHTYCQLLLCQSTEDTVKLVLLDRINELINSSHRGIVDIDMTMDFLIRELSSSSNLDIRRKTLVIIVEQLITPPNNVNETIRACAVKFPEVASTLVELLLDFFFFDDVAASAVDLVAFVRGIIETNSDQLRASIVKWILDNLYKINVVKVCRSALWIIGEYCHSFSEVMTAIFTILQCVQDSPFSKKQVAGIVQGSLTTSGNLRTLLLAGDFFLGAFVACTLTKLGLRLEILQPFDRVEVELSPDLALLIRSAMPPKVEESSVDNDSHQDMIYRCTRLLFNTRDVSKLWLSSCHGSLTIAGKQQLDEIKANEARITPHSYPDYFCYLKLRKGMSQLKLEDDLKCATTDAGDHKLNCIIQLTEYSDLVYVEAYVTVHRDDIVLDVIVSNRTNETLENMCLKLATVGDLKLIECPQNYTLAPESSKKIKANIKVLSCTETGVVFGNVVYETSNMLDRTVVVLNDIHVDIMDYKSPAVCSHTAFRTIWADFNKAAVNTTITNEKGSLAHVIRSTNMNYISEISANLYARSVYRKDDGKLN